MSFKPPKDTIPIRISPETTFLIEPVDATGNSIDYVRVIEGHFAPKSPPTENGYRDVVEALGKTVFFWIFDDQETSVDEELWNDLCRKLDLDPNLIPSVRYEPLERTKPGDPNNDFEDDIVSKLQSKPWTDEEYPKAEHWLRQSEAFFRLIETAIRKPNYYFSFAKSSPDNSVYPGSLLLPNIAFPREISRCLSIRTLYRLGQSQWEAAWNDVLLIFKLARHVQNHPLLIAQLVGMAIEGVANARALDILKHAELDKHHLQGMIDDLDNLREPLSTREIVFSERLYGLAELQWRSVYGPDDEDLSDEFLVPDHLLKDHRKLQMLLRRLPVDWNVVLNKFNDMFDRIPVEESEMLKGWEAFPELENERMRSFCYYRFTDIATRSEDLGKRLLNDTCSAWTAFWGAFLRNKTTTELTRIAFLLEMERLRNDEYPHQLDDLVHGGLLPGLPIDRMDRSGSGGYRYRREGDGYLLYSVGMSGEDDGGKPFAPETCELRPDDICIRMP